MLNKRMLRGFMQAKLTSAVRSQGKYCLGVSKRHSNGEGVSRRDPGVPAGGILSLAAIAKMCWKYFCFLIVVVSTQIYTCVQTHRTVRQK